ncbi:pentapeptide repeat-containing protein [Nocardia sp. NPDC057668]|uniref:pentapeptide repeat-containing protein n=1 Tax=Nocardia sp. NPDC057668 TaxID=3346202 RepID=UPI00366EA45C
MKRASRAFFGWGGWSKLASMVTTVAALAALWFTNESLRATSDQAGLARQTAITDRFAKAIEQLGNEKLDVRLGGVYLLERLAKDSPNDRPQIFEVLSAFVRTHAPNTTACGKDPQAQVPTDVQAVLTVIGRREVTRIESLDLSNTCLVRMSLANANLQGALLDNANLTSALLSGANLSGAMLEGAQLESASLLETNLSSARLLDANMKAARLSVANLDGADLGRADLRGAFLVDANLNNTNFRWADVRATVFAFPAEVSAGFLSPSISDDPSERRTDKLSTYRGGSFGHMRFDSSTLWPEGFTP